MKPVSKKQKTTKPTNTASLASKKYIRNKTILIGMVILFALILYIDSKTGFIKSLFGDKIIEIRIRK